MISKTLSNLIVYLRGKDSKTLENLPLALEETPFNQIYSLNDRKAMGFQKNLVLFQALAQCRMIRVYPSIIRVNSSNFDPISHWLCGVQMVALNFQTLDRAMELNTALFESNGKYGYVLKPRMDPNAIVAKTLSLRIISAQQIHQNISDQNRAEIVIEIIGNAADCIKSKTFTAKSNGFNTIWTQDFVFQLVNPSFAFLRLEAFDIDSTIGSSSAIGACTIFLPNLMEGFKHLTLRNRHGDTLGFTQLFCFFQWI